VHNILIFTLEFPPFLGGVSTYNHNLAVGVANLGYRVNVLTRHYASMSHKERQFDKELFENRKIRVFRKTIIPRMKLIQWVFHLMSYRYLSSCSADYILITDNEAQRVASFIIFKWLKMKYFITVHGSEVYSTFLIQHVSKGLNKLFFPLFKHFAVSFYSKADGVIFVSKYSNRLFFKYFKNRVKRYSVIHNGIDKNMLVDHEKLESKYLIDKSQTTLITISRIDPRKNHENVIKAISLIPADMRRQFVYIIVGDGPHKTYLEDLTVYMGLTETVRFYGRVTEKRKIELLDLADIFIMTSKKVNGTVEGLGISFLEAGARGLPLIGGKHGGVPEVITAGVNGFLVDPERPGEIKDAILTLAFDRKLSEKMGRASLRVIKRAFLLDKMVTETIDFMCEESD